MKILLLNQVFYPDAVATANFLSDLAVELAERGHKVTVVAARRAYNDPDKNFPGRENWRGVRVFRVYSTRFGKKAKWRRAADFASFIFFCCVRLLFMPRQDAVIALTTPPLISFIGACRAKMWGAKSCYWVMDMNPDEAIAAGWLKKDSPTGKVLEWMSRFSFHHSDQIIALDRFMRERIVDKGISPDKITVIPPWSHDNEIHYDPVGRETFRKKYGLENKFVVMYAGNHSPVHPLDTLMGAAEQLKNDTSITFCFVGSGSEFHRIKQWAAEGKYAGVLCLPHQPLSTIAPVLSAADAHVVVMGQPFVGLVHPCKIYNILAVGAPVLYVGPKPSHVTEIFDQLDEGYPRASVGHGDSAELMHRILDLRTMRIENSANPTGIMVQFSQEALLSKLIATIEDNGKNEKGV